VVGIQRVEIRQLLANESAAQNSSWWASLEAATDLEELIARPDFNEFVGIPDIRHARRLGPNTMDERSRRPNDSPRRFVRLLSL
jgi:hypothetical protein